MYPTFMHSLCPNNPGRVLLCHQKGFPLSSFILILFRQAPDSPCECSSYTIDTEFTSSTNLRCLCTSLMDYVAQIYGSDVQNRSQSSLKSPETSERRVLTGRLLSRIFYSKQNAQISSSVSVRQKSVFTKLLKQP